MELDITLIVIVLTIGLFLLGLIQFFLAWRHDRAIAAAGPIKELVIYDKEIDGKKRLLSDIEKDIEKNRETVASLADKKIQVEQLNRQKEQLLTEWEQLHKRREEILSVKKEIKVAENERFSLESALVPLRAEHLEIRERLKEEEDLAARIDVLLTEFHQLTKKIDTRKDTLKQLDEAKSSVEHLVDRQRELHISSTQLEGQIQGLKAERDEMANRVAAEKKIFANSHAEHESLQSGLAAARQEFNRTQNQIENLNEARNTLKARIAVHETEISEANKQDPLHELKKVPPVITVMKKWNLPNPRETETEISALLKVKDRLKAKGLEYPSRTLYAFHTAMKVNETTQMAVLAGISGTGKSQLPRQYAAGMGIGFLQVPVQPRWDSPQDLMGFYNYMEKKFRPTDMARALYALDGINNKDALQDRMMMILLDEMNLARIEYYFSDFLSRLESRPGIKSIGDYNERKDSEIELEIPGMTKPPRIFPGYNLLFAGTMNEDESTQSLSDKVMDRANILHFAAPQTLGENHTEKEKETEETTVLSQKTWNKWVRPVTYADRHNNATEQVEELMKLMKAFKRPFGHRLGRAMIAYVANYPEAESAWAFKHAIADQIEMRLLPKLRGIDAERTNAEFAKLDKFVRDDVEDDELADAIFKSVQTAIDGTGQFAWTGVTR